MILYFRKLILWSISIFIGVGYSLAMENKQGEKRAHDHAFSSPSSDDRQTKRPRIEELSDEPLSYEEEQELQASLKKLGATGDFAIPTTDTGFKRLKYSKWNPKEKREYKRDVRDKEQNQVLLAVERAEGKEEGLKEGIEIGKIQIALKMIEQGFKDDLIVQITELTPEQLQELKDQQ